MGLVELAEDLAADLVLVPVGGGCRVGQPPRTVAVVTGGNLDPALWQQLIGEKAARVPPV